MKPRKGRTLNETRPASVIIHLNLNQVKHINTLVLSGLWGHSPAECGRRLIDQGLLAALPQLPK